MAAIKDEAIVLRRLDYSETSQVLVFLTREHGLRRLIAKGIRRVVGVTAETAKNAIQLGTELLERADDLRNAGAARAEGCVHALHDLPRRLHAVGYDGIAVELGASGLY